jgi:hypothetical protein
MQINYNAPPTVSAFMASSNFIRLLAGPVGSGKTTGMIFEIVRRSAEQMPARDGYRYTRWAIVRQTLQQIKQTILKDILSWLRGIVVWRVSESTIYLQVGDIRSELILLPLENLEDQRRLLSSNLTGIWISECIEIDAGLIDPLVARCGRFPDPKLVPCTWKGMIMDTNMPEEGSAWHELMENPEAHWSIFKQPGGLDEDAENLAWLDQTPETMLLAESHPDRLAQGVGYYIRAASGRSEEWVDRYVRAKYGIDPSGRAVFGSTFRATTQWGAPWHVVPHLDPIPGQLMIVGQDFGRDPCAALMQVDPLGRLLVLDEIISHGMGLQLHVQTKLRPLLSQVRYLGIATVIAGDPSGVAKNNINEETSFDFLRRMGFVAFPTPTNDFDPRVRAVESWLLESRGAGAACLIDGGRCPNLVRALKTGYRFKLVQETHEPGPRPMKNEHSHIAEAFQYGCQAAQPGTLAAMMQYMRVGIGGHGSAGRGASMATMAGQRPSFGIGSRGTSSRGWA